MITITRNEARRFLLLKHGLLGDYRFCGKDGVLAYIRQTGCIQFDPVDACGKNAELVLQSRVKGFTKQMLGELLYEERMLIDYPDKNLSILPAEDWPCFARYRKAAREGGKQFAEIEELSAFAKHYIGENGPVSSDQLPVDGVIHWHSSIHWSGNWHGTSNAARSVLEQLYSTGELVIHHKKGTRKFYDLASRQLPAELLAAPDPHPDEFEHKKWRVLRRIGAVGLLWNRPSDAWLNIWNLTSADRSRAFEELLSEGRLLAVQVEELKPVLYCRSEDLELLQLACQTEAFRSRCELIAPLDCMMWDRKLIRALFDFDYAWEIYTPAAKRKYGFYVLPLLYGERFVGRVEAVADQKSGILTVKNLWYEDGVRRTKKLDDAIARCIRRFAKFNLCREIRYESETLSTLSQAH